MLIVLSVRENIARTAEAFKSSPQLVLSSVTLLPSPNAILGSIIFLPVLLSNKLVFLIPILSLSFVGKPVNFFRRVATVKWLDSRPNANTNLSFLRSTLFNDLSILLLFLLLFLLPPLLLLPPPLLLLLLLFPLLLLPLLL